MPKVQHLVGEALSLRSSTKTSVASAALVSSLTILSVMCSSGSTVMQDDAQTKYEELVCAPALSLLEKLTALGVLQHNERGFGCSRAQCSCSATWHATRPLASNGGCRGIEVAAGVQVRLHWKIGAIVVVLD